MATIIVPDDYGTIGDAIQHSSHITKDTIRVRAGTYAEDIDWRISAVGGWLSVATVEAYDPANKPVVTGAGGTQTVRKDALYNAGAAGLKGKIKNLVFDTCAGSTNGVIYGAPPFDLESVDFVNTTTTCMRWVGGDSGRPSIVQLCTSIAADGVAFAVTGVTDYATIRNCTIVRTAATTAAITGTTSDGNIYNNSVYVVRSANSWTAITGKLVTNNTIQNAGTAAAGGILAGTYTTNALYGSFTTPYSGSNGGGNLSGSDPLYTNPATGNLLPQTGSPLIDAGTTLGSFSDSINGVTRPSGSAWDIGAYEVLAVATVTGITVLGPTSIRLDLSDVVSSDATWEDAGNYTITPSGGAAAVTVTGAAISSSTTITLTTTEHTNGGDYNLAWAGLTNITSGNDDYTGEGESPTVTAASMTAAKVVRVTFSEPMTNNAALTTVGNYTVTGATVASVARVDSTHVDVTLVARIPLASSTVTVNGPQDLALNPVDNSSQAFAVPYLTMVSGTAPSRYTAQITFNLAPTSGVSAATDWTVTPASGGVVVAVTGVVATSATVYTVTVWPQMSPATGYVVAAPSAANAAGPVG